MDEFGVKTMDDVHAFVKMLTAETIQAALDGELENELGYSKYDYKNKNTDNSRNGYSTKTVQGRLEKWRYLYHGIVTESLNRSL